MNVTSGSEGVTYSVLDLFSGIGGIALAMQQTERFKISFTSEIDVHASLILSKHHPDVQNLGDITKIKDFPCCDVIAGGFPCQDIAHSGPGTGLNGARSGLWFHMLRAIQQTQPLGVLIENVDMLAKRGLDVILQGLATAGYDAEWYTIRASGIGAPHRRKRLYVIAYRVAPREQGPQQSISLVPSGHWLWAFEADLRKIYGAPFERSDRWPEPLLRGVDVRSADWAHRINQIGNGVVVPVVKQVASHLARRLDERVGA